MSVTVKIEEPVEQQHNNNNNNNKKTTLQMSRIISANDKSEI